MSHQFCSGRKSAEAATDRPSDDLPRPPAGAQRRTSGVSPGAGAASGSSQELKVRRCPSAQRLCERLLITAPASTACPPASPPAGRDCSPPHHTTGSPPPPGQTRTVSTSAPESGSTPVTCRPSSPTSTSQRAQYPSPSRARSRLRQRRGPPGTDSLVATNPGGLDPTPPPRLAALRTHPHQNPEEPHIPVVRTSASRRARAIQSAISRVGHPPRFS